MTYTDWHNMQQSKVSKIVSRLPKDEVIDYFNWDNMVKYEPDFCPLYKTKSKCHELEDLNCLFCACPHFRHSDRTPLFYNGAVKVMSICSLGSKKASLFVVDNTGHCNCSDCVVPHKNVKVLWSKFKPQNFSHNMSLIEKIRAFQLSDILGRYKLF